MREVIEQVLRFQSLHAYPLPLNVRALCRTLGLELRPVMDISRLSGLRAAEVYGIWGNRDGVLQRVGGRYVLSYSNYRPLRRQRFTICEEAAHYLLGHLDEEGFDLFGQSWSEEVYRRCEEEARLAAAMLLCPPRWYYAHREELDEAALSKRCTVSPACARRVIADYARLEQEIRACPGYGFVPVNAERTRTAKKVLQK